MRLNVFPPLPQAVGDLTKYTLPPTDYHCSTHKAVNNVIVKCYMPIIFMFKILSLDIRYKFTNQPHSYFSIMILFATPIVTQHVVQRYYGNDWCAILLSGYSSIALALTWNKNEMSIQDLEYVTINTVFIMKNESHSIKYFNINDSILINSIKIPCFCIMSS